MPLETPFAELAQACRDAAAALAEERQLMVRLAGQGKIPHETAIQVATREDRIRKLKAAAAVMGGLAPHQREVCELPDVAAAIAQLRAERGRVSLHDTPSFWGARRYPQPQI